MLLVHVQLNTDCLQHYIMHIDEPNFNIVVHYSHNSLFVCMTMTCGLLVCTYITYQFACCTVELNTRSNCTNHTQQAVAIAVVAVSCRDETVNIEE